MIFNCKQIIIVIELSFVLFTNCYINCTLMSNFLRSLNNTILQGLNLVTRPLGIQSRPLINEGPFNPSNQKQQNKQAEFPQKNLQIQGSNKGKELVDFIKKYRILKQNERRISRQLAEAKEEIGKLKGTLDEAKVMISYHQRQARKANQKQEKVNKQNSHLNEQINLLVNSSRDTIQRLETQNCELKFNQKKLTNQINHHLRHVAQLQRQIQYFNVELNRTNKREQQARQQVCDLKNQLHKIKNQRLFEGSILFDESPLKQELLTAIRIQSQNHLAFTKSVYFSSRNRINANFLQLKHNCNYVFVAKTLNRNYLSAVSFHRSDEQYQKLEQSGDFIIDLDSKTNFYPDKGKLSSFKVKGKDLIFGKHDLNIQMGEFRISTNIGSENSNFASSQWREGAFGEPARVFDIESFQVFELFLAND